MVKADLNDSSVTPSLPSLGVTLVQTSLHWHNPQANRQQLTEKLAPLAGQTDLVVLPEMFTSGFTNHPEYAHKNGETAQWLLAQARELGAAITGSIACALDDSVSSDESPAFVNRLLFATPEGVLHHYDKVHLFRMADEHKRYLPGNERCIICYRGWRLLLTICYDLRFPVFCRNRGDYDLMLCVANWPQARSHHWRTLLQARAIENQAYVLGVNRVGVDGNKLHYSGDSLAVNYSGELLLDQPGEWVATTRLNGQALLDYRKCFPAWQDADQFSLNLKK